MDSFILWVLRLNRKIVGAIGFALIIFVLAGIFLNQHLRIVTLEVANSDLLLKLENATQQLESLEENYIDSQKSVNASLKPKIVTRLGMKLIDISGGRFGDNYLWVTGEIQNMENFTAYNVQLLFKLFTDNGTQVKQIMFGTLKSYEVISIRRNVWSEIGTIKSWALEPVATCEP